MLFLLQHIYIHTDFLDLFFTFIKMQTHNITWMNVDSTGVDHKL